VVSWEDLGLNISVAVLIRFFLPEQLCAKLAESKHFGFHIGRDCGQAEAKVYAIVRLDTLSRVEIQTQGDKPDLALLFHRRCFGTLDAPTRLVTHPKFQNLC